MIFRPFYYYDRGCAAYLFGCGSLSRCAVVDARADDVDTYVTFAASKNMRITHVIDTHVHADHRSGGPELARHVAAAYCLHESADYDAPFTPVRDGEEIAAWQHARQGHPHARPLAGKRVSSGDGLEAGDRALVCADGRYVVRRRRRTA